MSFAIGDAPSVSMSTPYLSKILLESEDSLIIDGICKAHEGLLAKYGNTNSTVKIHNAMLQKVHSWLAD